GRKRARQPPHPAHDRALSTPRRHPPHRTWARPYLESAGVIDRDQVLHVARLARLRLDDAEVARMSGELSTILDHIEKIGELDLDDVEPTSHVIQVENVLRPDGPRPGIPREEALAPAAGPVAGG